MIYGSVTAHPTGETTLGEARTVEFERIRGVSVMPGTVSLDSQSGISFSGENKETIIDFLANMRVDYYGRTSSIEYSTQGPHIEVMLLGDPEYLGVHCIFLEDGSLTVMPLDNPTQANGWRYQLCNTEEFRALEQLIAGLARNSEAANSQ